MKLKTLVIIVFFYAATVSAENYKVVAINSTKILINGQVAKEGTVFSEVDSISWPNNKAAMRVCGSETWEEFELTAAGMKKRETATIKEYFRPLSSRNLQINIEIPEDTLYFIDTLKISVGEYYRPGVISRIRYHTTTIIDEEILSLNKDNKSIILTREQFAKRREEATSFDIVQYDEHFPEGYIVYRNLTVILLPQWLN